MSTIDIITQGEANERFLRGLRTDLVIQLAYGMGSLGNLPSLVHHIDKGEVSGAIINSAAAMLFGVLTLYNTSEIYSSVREYIADPAAFVEAHYGLQLV